MMRVVRAGLFYVALLLVTALTLFWFGATRSLM
jgi:hypothetical protein